MNGREEEERMKQSEIGLLALARAFLFHQEAPDTNADTVKQEKPRRTSPEAQLGIQI
jgi:hypothetical protein